jgi:uncharacterized protein with von Willebrand factor type A (vWA) domain
MRARLLGFVNALREAGVACSVSEALDANRAAAALGVERAVLRESLAATLIKDHGDRPTFDAVFDRYFGVRRRVARKREEPEEGSGDGRGGEGQGRGRSEAEGSRAGEHEQRDDTRRHEPKETRTAQRLAAHRALATKPFAAMDARDVDELRELVDDLGRRFRARWSRRARRARLGRVDMRRTIRRATTRGGVPLELFYRTPRPGKSDLVALIDVSYSTAIAADFLLALLAPARHFFRRVLLLAYVDRIVEVSFEHGHVVPHQPLDLNARSDFGRVLIQVTDRYAAQLSRNTVLLILGDARNNRRPPRADLLASLQQRVRAVIWVNPEQRERWDTGDSVMCTYARHCAIVVNAWNLQTLMMALSRVSRLA